jgi:hypothetical protein
MHTLVWIGLAVGALVLLNPVLTWSADQTWIAVREKQLRDCEED